MRNRNIFKALVLLPFVASTIMGQLVADSTLAFAQAPPSQSDGSGFNVGPAKDAVIPETPHDKTAVEGHAPSSEADSPNRTVGPQRDGSIVVSNNQTLRPAGRIVELGSPARAKAVALNPDQSTHTAAVLLMGSAQPIVIFSTVTGQILQRFTPADAADTRSEGLRSGSFSGITYSSDGAKLLFSQDSNYVAIADVDRKTGSVSHEQRVGLPDPPADGRPYYKPNLINPGGIAVSQDNKTAYVTLNVANTLGVIDLTATPARLTGQIPVGNAPNSVIVRGNYAYVSNEGGRPATDKDVTNYSDGTRIVVDRRDAFAITGTVSVVDLIKRKEVREIRVGLHPTGMAIHNSNLYVANAYGDSLSVIDLDSDRVVENINLSVPIGHGTFGSGPNSVAITDDGTAYITLGQANAVAVVNLEHHDAHQVIGYIPTAYFPSFVIYDKAEKQLVIADDKGLGSRGTTSSEGGVIGFNTHADMGAVNLIREPNASELAKLSRQVFDNNHWNLAMNVEVGPQYTDPHAAPVAIPRHIGEPSLIKHVFLIIKENRTYDQMLGDVPWGNGAAGLATFASATPNQHEFVKRFPLLDNVYTPGRQSADGHTWIGMSGSFYSNDILSPDWVRSYPGGYATDPLSYTPKGFLWTTAEAEGLSVRLYGWWSSQYAWRNGTTVSKEADGSYYTWNDFYDTALCKEGKAPSSSCIVPDNAIHTTSEIPSAARILDAHYPPFNLRIPDQYRMDYWIPEFKRLDAANQVPNLTLLWLPSDHTAGMSVGFPYPVNYVADNDLALGRLVETISHSKIWASSAIFVEEDDSQSGTDHVDGHRQPVYVISPYTVPAQIPGQGRAIHTTYTAENINRTIENILGMRPLTQFDLVASPMFDVFENTPDLTPYTHVAAVVPLNQGPGLTAEQASRHNPNETAWLKASSDVMKGKYEEADAVDPDFLNHAIWYSATHWARPYPGETKVLMPRAFVMAAKKYNGDDD